jgi:hypothetical protein
MHVFDATDPSENGYIDRQEFPFRHAIPMRFSITSIPMVVEWFYLMNSVIFICRRMQSFELMTKLSSDLKRDPDEVLFSDLKFDPNEVLNQIDKNLGGMVPMAVECF